MKEIDFSVCDFIEHQMWIVTYDDFCDRREGLKRLYKTFTTDKKMFYKWYVYANVHMEEDYKNAIWDYLNFDDVDYETELIRKQRWYKPKKG